MQSGQPQSAKAALAAGHKVVATGRNTGKVAQALGKSEDLIVVQLEITKPTDAESAVKASVDKLGRIDVVNNAANFYAGFFEELSQSRWNVSCRPAFSAR